MAASLSRKQRRKERRESRKNLSEAVNHNKDLGRFESNVFTMADRRPVQVRKTIEPKNSEQKRALNMIDNFKISVIAGQVGSGKTFLAACRGTEMLMDPNSKIDKLILVRPPEPLGKDLGHLPGTLAEKMRPWVEPILTGVEYIVGKVGADRLLEQGKIEYVAVQHLRGRTWNNCFVILDECNNLSQRAIAVSTLRAGQDAKLVYCGDVKQADVKHSGIGLFSYLQQEYETVPFAFTELTKTVRSPEASAFAAMYDELGIEY